LFFFVLCTLYSQFLWIVHFWLPLRYSLTFIDRYVFIRFHSSIVIVFCLFVIVLAMIWLQYCSYPGYYNTGLISVTMSAGQSRETGYIRYTRRRKTKQSTTQYVSTN
jgi:hypothetical protein